MNSIPYAEMFKNGICRSGDRYYTKSIVFEDINYALLQEDEQARIFSGWCHCYNYHSSAIPLQITCTSRYGHPDDLRHSVDILPRGDAHDGIRAEFTEMLRDQMARGNNGIEQKRYYTFGVEADSARQARPFLERIEADILNNLKQIGVSARPMNGYERLQTLYAAFHPDGRSKLHFSWDKIVKTGLTTKDFIAPRSLDFRQTGVFRMGDTWGAASHLVINANELNDHMLTDLLNMEIPLTVTLHLQPLDQSKAVKKIKQHLTDIDGMKIDEQKKSFQNGYGMDILPPDLKTYGDAASNLLETLQYHDERMFLVTILILHTAPTLQVLKNNILATEGIARKYNCELARLDFQQEQGLMSSLPLGVNQVEIFRSLNTSAAAIFTPFASQELFQPGGDSIYYGLNPLSNKLILCSRKLLKNPNGLILGTPGCLTGDTRIQLAGGGTITLAELYRRGGDAEVKCYNDLTGEIISATGTDPRISGTVTELVKITLASGDSVQCTGSHLILDGMGQYVHAEDLLPGDVLSGGHTVDHVETLTMTEPVDVYDLTVDRYLNFILDNGLIVHNSGKSFAAKREIVNVFLVTDDDIIIVDPEAEYLSLMERLGAQIIRLSVSGSGKQYINPMDINPDYSDEDDPLALKSDFILSLCELIVGGKSGLEPIEKTIIDRCVRLVYHNYLNDPRPENMPILEDLYHLLLAQKEKEAHRLATALEIYVVGSLNVFNHRTNVDLKSRLVCYDIKQLGKSLKKIAMLILEDQVWNRLTINRAAHRTTWFYEDEFHLMLKDEQTAAYSVEIWKRFRKWGGVPTGITQNVKELLLSPEIESIFDNSDFILMLNQSKADGDILAKHLGISDQQLTYATQVESGRGLLFYGNTIVPFKDEFPHDTELYRLMTTRPDEVAGTA